MSRKFATLKSFSVISFGNITSRIISAFISILLARQLGPSVFGNYSILFAVMTTIGLGFSGLDITYVHSAIKFKNIKFSNYFSTKILLFLIIVIPITLFSKLIINNYFRNISLIGFFIALIASFFFASYTTIYAYFQRHELYRKYAIVQVSYYFIVLIIILLGLTLFSKNIPYYYYLISYIIASILIFIVFIIKRKGIELKIDPDVISFFKFGKWIILSELSLVLFARLDLIILSHFITGASLGYYSAAIKIVNIYLVFTAAFSVIMLPKASKVKNKAEQKKFYKSGFLLVALLIMIAVVIMLSSKFVVILFYGKEYIPAFKYVILLLLAYLPFTLYQPFRYISYTFNNTRLLFIITLIQNIILISLGWYSIKMFGINGIIYIKGFAYLVALIIFVYMSYKMGKNFKYESNSL